MAFKMSAMIEKAKRILVVDDDKLNRRVLNGLLTSMGHEVIQAKNGEEALAELSPAVDLVLLDVMMPGMDGFEVTETIRRNRDYDDLPIIIVTTLAGRNDRLAAVRAGANDYIAKPIDRTELEIRTTSMLALKASRDNVHRYQQELEEMVAVRTRALEVAIENLREQQGSTRAAYLDILHRLASAAEFKDEETAHHTVRIGHMAALLAGRMGLASGEVELIQKASPMHDVGKIGIPDAILLKPGRLDPDEWEVMKRHSLIGARLLADSASEFMEAGSAIALSHHEKWDGSGYPRGLSGEDIPLFGRITAVADVFDALTSRRPYKEAFPREKALAVMREGRGSHFDPAVLDVFLDNIDEIIGIKEAFAD